LPDFLKQNHGCAGSDPWKDVFGKIASPKKYLKHLKIAYGNWQPFFLSAKAAFKVCACNGFLNGYD
jgi:hypothetical protein